MRDFFFFVTCGMRDLKGSIEKRFITLRTKVGAARSQNSETNYSNLRPQLLELGKQLCCALFLFVFFFFFFGESCF